MFIDEATIKIRAGKGGDGSASFRREKFIPKGGPDGGDGGDGGDVFVIVKENIHGLARVQAHRLFVAEAGQGGMSNRSHGKNGKDIFIELPPGTLVYERKDGTDRLLIDLGQEQAETFRVARGGRGGRGNIHFASATNQAPRMKTPGVPGEELELHLIVQHIADIGLVGLPNAGKSTLLSRISHATPKIADYPFTTLEPHLGMVDIEGDRFVVADIPGLIEGASGGKGLGHRFLRHLMRTTLLVHLIDAQSVNPEEAYKVIRQELEAFDEQLAGLTEVVAISRIDTLDSEAKKNVLQQLHHLNPIALSSISGEGVDELLRRVRRELARPKGLDNS